MSANRCRVSGRCCRCAACGDALRRQALAVGPRRGAHLGYPGGETLSGFAARVRAALARTLARTEGDLLVVAHRGVIRRIADALVPDAGDNPSALASLSTLRLEPPAVVRWNVVGG